MTSHRAAVFVLMAALAAPQAVAQDELLVPLSPTKEEPKPKKKPVRRRTTKKSAAKKPAPAPSPLDELVVPLAPAKTELLVKLSGDVKGARLWLDNKAVGVLPLAEPIEVAPGAHAVVVRRPGFAEFSRRFTVEQGTTHELGVVLEAVAGVVAVNADVPGAHVTVDGQPRGKVPLVNLELKPGTREIVVRHEGFAPEVSRINVRAGKDYVVNAHLRPAEGAATSTPVASADRPERPILTPTEPSLDNPSVPLSAPEEPEVSGDRPWYKRWYVWAGVGAVVAAAAAGTVVATQGNSAKPLTERDVCGPSGCDGVINGMIRF